MAWRCKTHPKEKRNALGSCRKHGLAAVADVIHRLRHQVRIMPSSAIGSRHSRQNQ